MRYYNIRTSTFTRVADKTPRPTLAARPTPVYAISSIYTMKGSEQLDALAVRAYGEFSEQSWYAIADANMPMIIANKADFTFIRTLLIPRF